MMNKGKTLVTLVLDGLKQRLDQQSSLHLQKTKGTVQKVTCTFNSPAAIEEIILFEKETTWIIPVDLREFLLIHNGAKLFQGEYGGEMHLYSLEEIKSGHLPHMPDHCYPIGYYEGEYLFVDSNQCKNNRMDYLLWNDSSLPFEDWSNLEISFELWLDRFIVSQGAYFWEWPLRNANTHYKK